MRSIFGRIPLILELFFSGIFIFFYSIHNFKGILHPFLFSSKVTIGYLEIFGNILPPILFLILLINYFQSPSIDQFFRKYIFSILVLGAIFITLGDLEFCFWLTSVHLLSSLLTIYEDDFKKIKLDSSSLTLFFKFSPSQIVLLSFILWILFGTFLLMLPISSAKPNTSLQFIDALFMATSASCVTGLSTVSVGNALSIFGQVVLLSLVQVGGLGIMILYGSTAILAGKTMQLKERVVMQDLLDASNFEEIIIMIISIVKYTAVVELWGGIVLSIGFIYTGIDFGQSLYLGFFHSIMAFCNAGFSTYDNSLEGFATVPIIHGTVAVLIILGGLGFVVLRDIRDNIFLKLDPSRLRMHSKLVLSTTGILLFVGTLLIFFGEFLYSLDNYTLWEKLQISFFQSVTLRTAGFDTIAISSLQPYTIYIMGIFMFIGAGPGSTGGGIKVSTFAILFQSVRTILNGRENVEVFDRTIPSYVVVKSTALTLIAMSVVAIAIFALLKIESSKSFMALYFEVLSAFGTVGLTVGITTELSDIGKFAITLLMYIGRVGPLTLVLGIGQQMMTQSQVEYPEGRVLIG